MIVKVPPTPQDGTHLADPVSLFRSVVLRHGPPAAGAEDAVTVAHPGALWARRRLG